MEKRRTLRNRKARN